MAHDTVLSVFVIIAAVAIVAQAGLMFGMYLGMRSIQREVEGIRSEVKQRLDPLTQSVMEILASSREPVLAITTNLAEISRILRERASRVDELVGDLVDKTRLQIARADQMVSGVLEKVDSTAEVIHRNVLAPIQEVSALIKGVKAGLDYLFCRRGSPTVTEATQDEQMFI